MVVAEWQQPLKLVFIDGCGNATATENIFFGVVGLNKLSLKIYLQVRFCSN